MIDAITLGLKDIIHNIKIYFVLILSIVTITVIFVSSTLSIFYADSTNFDKRLFQNYQLVPTSTDMSKNKQLLHDYVNLINENGTSYVISHNLTETYGITTMVVIGNCSLIYDQFKQEDTTAGYFIAGNNEPIDQIEYHGKEIKLTSMELSYTDLLYEIIVEEPLIIICLNSREDITDWLNFKDGITILELFDNSMFEKEISHYEKTLTKLFEGSFISMAKIESGKSEKHFIFNYIYPFVFITALCVFISFWLFYDHYLKKMYYEYTIHMLYGAQKKHIMLRNSVAMLFILVISFLLFFIIKQRETSMIVNFGYLFIICFVFILEIITVLQINDHDRLKNMKGVNQ